MRILCAQVTARLVLPVLIISAISLINFVTVLSKREVSHLAKATDFPEVNIWNATIVDVLTGIKNPERCTLIDVRDQDAYKNGHIPGAISAPLQEILGYPDEMLATIQPRQIVIFYCAGSMCSSALLNASEIARKLDIVNIGVYGGGFEEWKRCGLNVNEH